jgi:hypothetical protein
VRRAAAALLASLVLAAALVPARAADYSFDLSEIEPRPHEWGGYLEGQFEHFSLDPDAPLYPLNFGAAPPRTTLDRLSASFELWGRYRRDLLAAYARVSGRATYDAIASTDELTLLEGGLRLSPSEGLTFDLGKQMQRWGKGYAWNPVAFFERPKDPNDPALSREGFVMIAGDWVKSFPGPLAAVGVSALVLPVDDRVNEDYGRSGHSNPGAKLYLLVADTDIDLLWAGGGSRPRRFGADFSRNLGANLEIHGEWARAFDAQRPALGADGTVRTEQRTADSWLVGARYITEQEVTWIAELYRNGLGFSEDELEAFYRQLDAAFDSAGATAAQDRLRALAQAGYGRANPGRRYAYLRVSAKDPFDWLYVNPALTAIANLEDGSWQVTPEVVYTGWQDVELRARLIALEGSPYSEFGAKPGPRRLELRLRLYF